MYCPKCKNEYREGFSTCSDCHIPLVEHLSEESIIQEDGMNIVKITSVSNEVDAGLIMDLLFNNNIPCFKKSVGSGGYMNIFMGYSIFGEEIYVSEKDVNKAQELLNELSTETDITDETDITGETDITDETDITGETDITDETDKTDESDAINKIKVTNKKGLLKEHSVTLENKISEDNKVTNKNELYNTENNGSDNTKDKIPFYRQPHFIARIIIIIYFITFLLSVIMNNSIS
jgi:hypothetical protein